MYAILVVNFLSGKVPPDRNALNPQVNKASEPPLLRLIMTWSFRDNHTKGMFDDISGVLILDTKGPGCFSYNEIERVVYG